MNVSSKNARGCRRESRIIWIDLDNSPHIPFFNPIIRELEGRGYEVVITARDCFQVCGLADLYQLPYMRIGVHYGKNKLMKAVGLVIRSAQLAPLIMRRKPDLAVSHGSRSQILLAAVLKLPSVLLMDYEYSQKIAAPTWILMPEAIASPNFPFDEKRVLHYPGIKEDVYVGEFKPDPSIRKELGLDPAHIVATLRPPATEAHYHNPESEILFTEVMRMLGGREDVVVIVLPRNDKQETYIRNTWPEYVRTRKIRIPERVLDGLNLIWHSDLVISGGGTINREAAALGVPVYSIFRGKLGAIDRYLSQAGKLRLIGSKRDVHDRIEIVRRRVGETSVPEKQTALETIVKAISDIAEGAVCHEGHCGKSESGYAQGDPYQAVCRRPGKDV